MAIGYIYILTNESMPGLVKVGKTTNDPSMRAGQLSAATGIPKRFSLYKHYMVCDCDEAERFAHRVLEKVFGRPNADREFFNGDPKQIMEILDEALASRTVRQDSYSLSDFQQPMGRLIRKEFTMGCMEFEALFKQMHITEEAIATSDALRTAVGAYLACCYAVSRRPYNPSIIGVKVKGHVMERAIEFAKEFEGDPATPIIHFVRSIE